MSNEPNNYLNPEPPERMSALFEELKALFEEFPDSNELNLEEMQRGLDEQQDQPRRK